jgi:hypothetical protein
VRTAVLVNTVLLVAVFWFCWWSRLTAAALSIWWCIGSVVDLYSYTVLAGLSDVDGDVLLLLLFLLVAVLTVLLTFLLTLF